MSAPKPNSTNRAKNRIDVVEQVRGLPMRRLRGRQFFAVDHPDHPVHACGNTAREITRLEFRRDLLIDNALWR